MNILQLTTESEQNDDFSNLLTNQQGITVHARTDCIEAARDILQEGVIDLVLAELNLKDSHGLGTVATLLELDPGIPVIACGDSEDEDVALSTVKAGAQDYLSKKNLTSGHLNRTLKLAWQRHLNLRNHADLAQVDVVSGLRTRTYLEQALQQMLARAKRNQTKLAVLSISIPEFAQIEVRCGVVLCAQWEKTLAGRLNASVRESDLLARFQGGHFVYVMEGGGEHQDVVTVVQKIKKIVASPVVISGREIEASCEIGIAMFPDCDVSQAELIGCAESAMQFARENGRDYYFYASDIQAQVEKQQALCYALAGAIQHREFELNYQPVFHHDGQQIVGLEALLRWNSDAGEVPPSAFLSVAEESGLILEIGEWVLHEACQQLLRILPESDVYVSVNISSRQFHQSALVDHVRHCLETTGLAPERLELEIKEEVFLEDPVRSNLQLQRLRELGVRTAVDDFGLGYFSLNVIKDLAIDRLKIDQSFIRGIGENEKDEAVISIIISLAHSLSLTVIAEGVERSDQLNFLNDRECDAVQGYLLSYPIPAVAVQGLLAAQTV